jgi:membrane protease YdiL (CAAX protease family)
MPPCEPKLTPRFRLVSGIEFLLGAIVVIGHNVFRILPNEVPILVVAGLVSFRLRNRGWPALGLGRPASWRRTLMVALAAAALRIVLGEFVIEPLAAHVWPPIAAPAGAETIAGNLPRALLAFLLVWTFAAFGEELSYRGFLITRAADVGGRSTVAFWCGASVVAVLFGFGHYYKGPAGIVDSGIAGLILGTAFLLTGRNLWAPILAHGLIDTFAVASVYLGWDS